MLEQAKQTNSGGGDAPAAAESGLSREAYALLAQANLLRVRGHWAEAVDACRAALRLAPESAAAQSLLGDIYENQGALDEAAQWYRMALDSTPDSAADRMKLDRLLGHQEAASPAALPPRPAAPERIIRALAFAAVLMVLLISGLAFSAARRHAASPLVDTVVKSAPVVVASAAGQSAPVRDSAEQSLMDTLNAAPAFSGQNSAVQDVQIDPRSGRTSLTVGLQAPVSGRTNIERAALTAALAASAGTASDFTVRCVSPAPSGAGTLVFVGDVFHAALPAVPVGGGSPVNGLSDAQVETLFVNQWWSLSIPS